MKALWIAIAVQAAYVAAGGFYVRYVGEPPTWAFVLCVISVLAVIFEWHAIVWIHTERGRVRQEIEPQRGSECIILDNGINHRLKTKGGNKCRTSQP
jgi:hypothetical protein